ncbi:hypothetical protein H1R20_g13887, partial [Candolleomyces eurysporus]
MHEYDQGSPPQLKFEVCPTKLEEKKASIEKDIEGKASRKMCEDLWLNLGGMPAVNGAMAMATFSRPKADSLRESSSADAIKHRGLEVSSKGNITATFSVPGLMTIPSDNVAHKGCQVHLKAVVKNASEYTLLRGPASVPEETFDCPLGPSIRVTYHPLAKKLSQSGFMFMSRTRNYVFSQRITVHNTKSLAIDNLAIVD